MSAVIQLTDETFDTEVVKSAIPVLVDFFAEWCGPCKRISPIVHEIAAEYAGRLKVCSVDVVVCQQSASQYGIFSIPTLLFFKNGVKQDQIVGMTAKDAVVQKITRLL